MNYIITNWLLISSLIAGAVVASAFYNFLAHPLGKDWPFNARNSDKQLSAFKRNAIEEITSDRRAMNIEGTHFEATPGRKTPFVFTCDGCPEVKCCALAYAAYNIDGDCLADK